MISAQVSIQHLWITKTNSLAEFCPKTFMATFWARKEEIIDINRKKESRLREPQLRGRSQRPKPGAEA